MGATLTRLWEPKSFLDQASGICWIAMTSCHCIQNVKKELYRQVGRVEIQKLSRRPTAEDLFYTLKELFP